MVEIYLGLGTNLGDRAANLQDAIQALAPDVQETEPSPVFETPPWGVVDQPPFLNQVLRAQTHLRPRDLLSHIKKIETHLGRKESIRYGPRIIDLDILFYRDLILDEPGLTIPHIRLHERAFVLVPLACIAPSLVHPLLQVTVETLLKSVDTTGVLRVESEPIPGD